MDRFNSLSDLSWRKRETILTLIPISTLTALAIMFIRLDEIPLSSIVGAIVSVAFVIYSFFLPRYIDEIRETHRALVEKDIDALVLRPYIDTHKRMSLILLRSAILTLFLFVQLIFMYIDISIVPTAFENTVSFSLVFRGGVVATVLVLISNISYLMYFVSRQYYERTRNVEDAIKYQEKTEYSEEIKEDEERELEAENETS